MSDMDDEDAQKLMVHQTNLLPLLEGPVLETVVGIAGATVTWNVPKLLLTKHSKFFQAACEKRFKEGIENKITLPDIPAMLFRHFVEWLYCGRVGLKSYAVNWVTIGGHAVNQYLAMWILGDRFLAQNFKNYVMGTIWDEFYYKGNQVMNPDDVDYCWNNTTTTSKLRSFILGILSTDWKLHNKKSDPKKWTVMLKKHPELRDELLFCLGRKIKFPAKEYYMEV